MRRSALAVAAVLVVLVPAATQAFQWNARAGVDYRRQDDWNTENVRTTTPRLDLDLSLDTRGALGGPGVLDWGGAVSYRRLSVSYAGETESLSEGIAYRLNATAFGDARSPFTVSARADRSQQDHSTGASPSGTALTETYATSASLRFPRRPRLELGYTRSSSEQSNAILGDLRSERDLFTVSSGFGTSVLTYNVNYQATLSDGTFDADKYDEHRANVIAAVNLDRQWQLQLTDAFSRRQPTIVSDLSPRQEVNFVALRLSETPERGERDFWSASYTYATGFNELPTRPAATRASHRVTYLARQTLHSPRWWVLGTATLSHDEHELDGQLERSAGQALGATAHWRRERGSDSLEFRLGPSLGLLEEFDGRVQVGYGGQGGASVQRVFSGVTTRAVYDLTYANQVTESGWSFGQQLTLGAVGALGAGTLSGQLLASARRAETALRPTANRSVTGVAAYTTRRRRVELRLGVEDGVSGAVADPLRGDALFIAPFYDSHVRFATLNLSSRLTRQLSLNAAARITSTELRDRPGLDEQEASGGISYAFGAFGFAIEDRYVISTGDGGTRRVNGLFVRAYRAIGGGRGSPRP